MRFIFYFQTIGLFLSCAQVTPLTGGFKDTIPPGLISSYPKNRSIEQNSMVFNFVFTEPIDASKLNESLIISPFYEGKKEIKYKKNTLNLSFDTAFNKNTTYILNFADGVADITEGNPAIDLKYIFSTGAVIDSSYISGFVFDPLKNSIPEKSLVCLYPKNDSLGLFTKKPLYFSFTDEKGFFKIENVKKGNYKIYAYVDENKNFTAEYKAEKFGVVHQNIKIDTSKNKLIIPIYSEDLSEMAVLRSRSKGNVFDINYSKKIDSINFLGKNSFYYSLNDNNILSLYKNNLGLDSVLSIIEAYDSYGYSTVDSIYVKFDNREVKKTKTTAKIDTYEKLELDDTLNMIISYSKPLITKNIDYWFGFDTLRIPNNLFNIKIDTSYTNKINLLIKLKKDSAISYLDKLIADIEKDSLEWSGDSTEIERINYLKNIKKSQINFKIEKGSMITIEKDTVDGINKTLYVRGDNFYGGVQGQIKSVKNKNYIIELISTDFRKKYKNSSNNLLFDFKYVYPGKYFLRVIEDINKNNKWDYRSVKSKENIEKIIYYNDELEVRSNWLIESLVFDVDLEVDKMLEK